MFPGWTRPERRRHPDTAPGTPERGDGPCPAPPPRPDTADPVRDTPPGRGRAAPPQHQRGGGAARTQQPKATAQARASTASAIHPTASTVSNNPVSPTKISPVSMFDPSINAQTSTTDTPNAAASSATVPPSRASTPAATATQPPTAPTSTDDSFTVTAGSLSLKRGHPPRPMTTR